MASMTFRCALAGRPRHDPRPLSIRAKSPCQAITFFADARFGSSVGRHACLGTREAWGETASALSMSLLSVGAVAAVVCCPPALADLNAREYSIGGEFGNGTALQYGEATIDGKDFSGLDLRRSNFTSASAKGANFKGANLQGAYFIKAVTYKANFEDANLSDVLMDRAVMNEANLRNAVLTRAVFTRSDLTGADVEGADFSNALLDRTQQLALCKYASGTNPVTGASTRKSLGCGSMRKFRASTPSNPEGPQVSDDEKDAFRASLPVYRQ